MTVGPQGSAISPYVCGPRGATESASAPSPPELPLLEGGVGDVVPNAARRRSSPAHPPSDHRPPRSQSVFRKSSKVTLDLPVPPHARDRSLPPTFHCLQRTLMGGVTFGDHLLQMPILRLDHLIGRRPPEFELTRPTQLLTCHDLHACPFPRGLRTGIRKPRRAGSYGASFVLLNLSARDTPWTSQRSSATATM